MSELRFDVEVGSRPVADLRQVDPEALLDAVLEGAGEALRRGLQVARGQGLPEGSLDEAALAWAVACSLGRAPPDDCIALVRDADHAHGRAVTLPDVLGDLDKPRGAGGATGWSELAWIVACEKKASRRRTGVVDAARADAAFAALYLRLHDALVQYLRRHHADAEDLAHDAWLAFCGAYLDAHATSRFRCRSAILTALCCNARRAAHRRRSGRVQVELASGGSAEDGAWIEQVAAQPACAEGRIQDLWRRLEHCLLQLKGKQRLVATLRLVQQVPATEIARRLGVVKSSISNLMQRAREKIQSCLQAQGIGPEWAAEGLAP